MKVLAVLQNQWFHDPAQVRGILERTVERVGKDAAAVLHRKFCARALFAGCRTGQILRQTMGEEWCRRIVWENASPELGGHAASKFPADMDHLRAVLDDVKPDIVIAFGRIASNALAKLVPGDRLVIAPHPTARQPGTLQRLEWVAETITTMERKYKT